MNNSQEETFKSLIPIALSGLKSIFILNAGSIIAILAFLGKVYEKEKCLHLINIQHSLYFFIAGLVFAALTYIPLYFTQFRSLESNKNWKCYRIITFVIGILGLVCFIIGSLVSVSALINLS